MNRNHPDAKYFNKFMKAIVLELIAFTFVIAIMIRTAASIYCEAKYLICIIRLFACVACASHHEFNNRRLNKMLIPTIILTVMHLTIFKETLIVDAIEFLVRLHIIIIKWWKQS
jgi:hypothetical protein